MIEFHYAAAAQMANSKWQNWKPMETSTCVMNACRNGGQAQPKLNRNNKAKPIANSNRADNNSKNILRMQPSVAFSAFSGEGPPRGAGQCCQTAPEKKIENKRNYVYVMYRLFGVKVDGFRCQLAP